MDTKRWLTISYQLELGSRGESSQVETIMQNRIIVPELSAGRRLVLGITGAAALVLPAAVGIVSVRPGWSQQAEARREFEVASVKPGDPTEGASGGIAFLSGGRIRASNATLKMLIMTAYNVRDFQLSGGPDWRDVERYTIEAVPGHPISIAGPNSSGANEVREMLQSLLARRFRLSIHRDTKEMPMYALIIAKRGPRLKESPTQGLGPESTAGGNGRGHFNARQVPVSVLAPYLSNQLERMVVDRTGLKGFYDFKLDWTPDSEQAPPVGLLAAPDSPRSSDNSGPSIFAALQEQLGLKLEPIKGPVDI
jgi:bla regulator protein blaR1